MTCFLLVSGGRELRNDKRSSENSKENNWYSLHKLCLFQEKKKTKRDQIYVSSIVYIVCKMERKKLRDLT